jgi:hypothetical protein
MKKKHTFEKDLEDEACRVPGGVRQGGDGASDPRPDESPRVAGVLTDARRKSSLTSG